MSKSPTSDLLFDVLSIDPKEQLFKRIPDLLDVGFNLVNEKDFPKEIDRYSFVIYTVLLYSPDAHMDMQTGPLMDRKRRAANIAGFRKGSKEDWSDVIKSMLFYLEDSFIRKVIHHYMRLHPLSNDTWRTLVFYEQLILEIEVEMLKKKVNTEKKVKMIESRQDLIEKKNRVMQEFYGSHEDVERYTHQSALFDSIEDWAQENVTY